MKRSDASPSKSRKKQLNIYRSYDVKSREEAESAKQKFYRYINVALSADNGRLRKYYRAPVIAMEISIEGLIKLRAIWNSKRANAIEVKDGFGYTMMTYEDFARGLGHETLRG